MNKIHPAFMILLLVVLAVFIDIKRGELSKNIMVENRNISKLNIELKNISLLKNRWLNSKNKIASIMKNSTYKGVDFTQESFKNRIIVKADNMTPNQLKTFTNKILNSYIKIKKLRITRSNQKTSILLEIEL